MVNRCYKREEFARNTVPKCVTRITRVKREYLREGDPSPTMSTCSRLDITRERNSLQTNLKRSKERN